MVKKLSFLLSLLVSLVVSGAASAIPVDTAPMAILVNGDTKLVFVGYGASDTTYLSEVDGLSKIFCDKAADGCEATPSGSVVDLGTRNGTLNFTLTDVTVPNVFDTSSTASDGYYHVRIAANYADLGIFAMQQQVQDIITGLLHPGDAVYYVAFEDRLHADYDYNDFVFAVIDPPVDDVPEPATWSLVLSVLMIGAAFGLRRRQFAIARR
jgi:hypothetical protein